MSTYASVLEEAASDVGEIFPTLLYIYIVNIILKRIFTYLCLEK